MLHQVNQKVLEHVTELVRAIRNGEYEHAEEIADKLCKRTKVAGVDYTRISEGVRTDAIFCASRADSLRKSLARHLSKSVDVLTSGNIEEYVRLVVPNNLIRLSGFLIGRLVTFDDLTNADLTGGLMWGAVFEDMWLEGALLESANLSCAILRNANLDRAKLYDATLKEAHIIGSSFKGADLTGADFYGATLKNVKFSRADLTSATFDEVTFEGYLETDNCVTEGARGLPK